VGANLADHGGVDIDCGYAGPARAAPVFHLLATFHSSATSSGEAPDLMLWLSDPRGDPPVFEIDAGLLKTRLRGRVRLRSANPAEPPCELVGQLLAGADHGGAPGRGARRAARQPGERQRAVPDRGPDPAGVYT
jgi:hypothetical protein